MNISPSPTNCSACDGALELGLNNPVRGWAINRYNLGGYGMFDDLIDEAQPEFWYLCHDCVVKFLKLFPRLGQHVPKGAHPSKTNEPCCDWSWWMIWGDGNPSGTLYLAEDGRWVEASG